ncbi:MAG: sulfurtransferase [Gammaproteobacteria bacterium]|nr:sulfurtransferase [Gammaproteobacteria bacterium]
MKNITLRWVIFIFLVIAITFAMLYRDNLNISTLQRVIEQAGPAAPLLFIALYAMASVIFLPGSVLTLLGGALFGPVLGTFYSLNGATIGAVVAFLLARYFASDWVEKSTAGQIKRLKEGVESEGWRFVAFVRLVPLFPFNLLNYALGLTRIRLLHYLIASYLCMLPGAFAYSYLGYAGREAVAGGESLIQKVLFAFALLAVVAFLPRIIGQFRQGPTLSINELQQRLGNDDELLLLDVRSTKDYQGELGHIQDSRNIPLEQLEPGLSGLSSYLEKPVAIICTTDRRSKKAARLLTGQGFRDVHVVSGGMTQWSQEKQLIS